MPVSIKDIARLAGVSHSTVSRALRNSSLISTDTTQRIQKIARQAGYTVSAVGRSLARQKTEAIGVVVTSISDPFNGEVVGGIEELANEHGYSVILATSQAEAEREIAAVRSFQARRVDGVLIASSRLGALHMPLLKELGTPVVLLNNQHPSEFMHSVSVDNVAGAYAATRHLLELGHSRIAYLGDRFGLHSDQERLEGYRKAMAGAGVRTRPDYLVRGDGKPESAQAAARPLLQLSERPTAIFCYNDMTALGVLQEAARMRLRIPEDLSLVGFDDIFFSSYLQPPLTTVCQPKRELGRKAMELLLKLLEGEHTKQRILLPGELAVRASTAKPNGSVTSQSEPGRTRPPGPRSTA